MANQLTTGQASGEQTTTQSPQISGSSTGNTAKSSNVQPGTATSLLSSQNGLSLQPRALSTINLGGTAPAQTQTAQPKPLATAHHINTTYLAIPAALLLIAVVSFWLANRSVKITTDY